MGITGEEVTGTGAWTETGNHRMGTTSERGFVAVENGAGTGRRGERDLGAGMHANGKPGLYCGQ